MRQVFFKDTLWHTSGYMLLQTESVLHVIVDRECVTDTIHVQQKTYTMYYDPEKNNIMREEEKREFSS